MMTLRVASRSLVLALVAAASLSAACFDDAVLENEDCASNADCAPSQECVITGYQQSLPEPYGWCRPEGNGCADGLQPGCACEIMALSECCSSQVVPSQPLSPVDTAQGCICVFSDDMDYPTAADNANGCIDAS